MKLNKQFLLYLALAASTAANAETLDWEKVKFWCGEGDNKAALVLQFVTSESVQNPGAIVWGFKWQSGENPTVEDMVRSVASANNDLLAMTQFTGSMGSTFCGAGYAKDVSELVDKIQFDFERAQTDSRISFGYFSPETAMGQTSAPGNETPGLVFASLDVAKDTHVIDHPLNQHVFGYPAYDYDWWQPVLSATEEQEMYWNAGWYDGYWSFWMGGIDMEDLAYSGMGMSSTGLYDGDVAGWKYSSTSDYYGRPEERVGKAPESSSWLPLNYDHFAIKTGLDVISEAQELPRQYYNIQGVPVNNLDSPGIYIVKQGNKTSKIYINK
ncbi:MAG: hypothetical protein HDR95_00980 [Bacteroides sp.]|nr:hypothetical protein [Bacteroides sp.]